MDSLSAAAVYESIGIIEKNETADSDHIIGTDDDLPELFRNGWREAFITVGSIGNTRVREKLFDKLTEIGFTIPAIIDPSAVISASASIAAGVFIGKRAVVNANARIGSCAIINTGAIVEHDCVVGRFAHISPGAVVCGEVSVGDCSHVGAGTVVRQQIRIGDHVMIGAGSTVVKDIDDNIAAFGNPCRPK
jgi:sugar O-acyltransferase (sialic acid O-acetyltransferase NeuD family)